ncbi:E3 ubiquitin-protein ligase MARCH7 [Astyanax mexicanus]|uniref:RING-type E3 ubiquitin transferase n=1 Tax=Astyanax mexicanus TaxID=7994 RepID=A0A8B9KTU4_ASTMX|nr:E3 ubiquitin-protein ligase MARCH7 [Astyanax mexicanus]
MDSKPRRLPFISSSSSLSSPSPISSSSALSASRLYGRGSVMGSDRFSRGTMGKLDTDYQSPCLSGATRDYSSSESRHSRWKLSTPLSSSSSSSSTLCERQWTESSYGGRSKPVDSQRGLGSYSSLLGTAQDSESKRAKLSYTNRAAYSRSSLTSTPSSTYTSLGSTADSSWKSTISPLSRSSSSSSSSSSEGLWARREAEKRNDSGLSGLGESSSYRPSSLSSSLYRPERVTSTYAQGARPKESLYSSRRESSSASRRLASEYLSSPLERSSHRLTSEYQPSSHLYRDAPSSTSTRTSSTSSSDPLCLSSWSSSPYTPLSERTSSPPQCSTAPVPTPAPEAGESEGRSTARRLLSRLFSRRSSQESSSASSTNSASRSFDSTSTEEAAPSEAPPTVSRESVETDPAQAFAFLRRREQALSPVHENTDVEPEAESLRPPAGLSWLNWNRCTPLFSRRRREGRDESARMEARRSPPFPLSSPEARKTSERDAHHDEDDDDEDEEEDDLSEGATASPLAGASGLSSALLQDAAFLPGRSPAVSRVLSSPLFRMPENVIIGLDVGMEGRSQAEAQAKEKPAPSRDPERLRMIQESLLLEDSDEEEGDLCRICQMGETSSSNPLIEPCRCTGSLQYVHQDCIKKWLRSKISSGSSLEAITTCELCKEKLHLNIENFDINELYRSHERSEYEFISCGLYLVVLLHLCEQRFSDVLGAVNEAGFFNLARTLHEHMDNLESSYAESDEEEVQDNRPSIDFCDLEDEEEEEEF